MNRGSYHKNHFCLIFSLVFLCSLSILASDAVPADVKEDTAGTMPESSVQRFVQEGISVEFNVDPIIVGKEPAGLMEGEDVLARFKITYTTTGGAVTGLHPSAWMDLQTRGQETGNKLCRKKIRAFMQGLFSARPTIDLNTYYILVLNQDSDISVIDPLYGFGGSRLFALVMLKSPGEDWVLSSDKKRLYVTMPLSNQVAVVDTTAWKVAANVDVGPRPARIALQPDERYLWVGSDAGGGEKTEGGVTVIDPAGPKVVTQIKTGSGHHEIAFTEDYRYAFVTNKEEGTLSVVDVQKLEKVKEIKTGRRPTAIAYSSFSKALYVSDEADGTIVVVDGQNHKILTKIKLRSGLGKIRFEPSDRFGFVVNSKKDTLQIFDSSDNRILQTIKVGKEPDQITFTKNFAYIRSKGSEEVSMIQLAMLGKSKTLPVLEFPGGQIPPGNSSNTGIADAIIQTPEGNSVLVANPADKTIYYYQEGMAAPMGDFQDYGRTPKALLVLERNLREADPGVYSTNVKLDKAGIYDVAFLLDSPRIVHCFEISVKPDPALRKKEQVAFKVEPMIKERTIPAGEDTSLRFKLTDPATSEPKIGIKDLRVLILLAPGVWHKREFARPIGDGIYEVAVALPKPGVYHIFFEARSLGVGFNQLPGMIIQATDKNGISAVKKPGETGENITEEGIK